VGRSYKAFTVFANLVCSPQSHLFAFFSMNTSVLDQLYALFTELLYIDMPRLAAQLRDIGVKTKHFLYMWLQSIFCKYVQS
jgi:hypothetical protein